MKLRLALALLLIAGIVSAQEIPQLNSPEYLQAKVFTLGQELNQAYAIVNKLQKDLNEVTKERDALKAKLKEIDDEK